MKIRILILTISIIFILAAGYQLSFAQSKSNEPVVKIGIVNSEKVLQQCKRGVAYQQQLKADQDKTLADLTKLKESMEADQEGLKVLKQGSEDYFKLLKLMLSKQSELETQKQYQKQRLEGKDQEWTKSVYSDFLQAVNKIAQSKGLIMVVEKREVEPTMTINDMMISTRPIIYSGGCVDISAEVLAALDAK